jgi:uncharacterized protein YjiS (DUF1127 family)
MHCIRADAAPSCLPKHQSPTMLTSVLLSKIRSYLKYRETVRELSRFQIDGIAKGYTA